MAEHRCRVKCALRNFRCPRSGWSGQRAPMPTAGPVARAGAARTAPRKARRCAAPMRGLRRLVGRVDPREARQRAAAGLPVQALGIALLGHGQRHVHVHLDEIPGREQRLRRGALGPERRDQRDDGDHPRVHEQPRHMRGPADALGPVRIGEAQVAAEPGAQAVTVEHESAQAVVVQRGFQRVREGGLARAREPGEPDGPGGVALQAFAVLAGDGGGGGWRREDHGAGAGGTGFDYGHGHRRPASPIMVGFPHADAL